MGRWDAKTPFAELMALETMVPGRMFKSKMWPWGPGGVTGAFGGHVYAQSVWAASQVVDEGMIVHNVHGYFTLMGLTDRCYVFEVTKMSTGGMYSTLLVVAKQPEEAGGPAEGVLGKTCFWCMISFKRDENAVAVQTMPSHQEVKDWERQYGPALKGKKPWEHDRSPSIDAPWFLELAKQRPEMNDVFPGLLLKKVDLSANNTVESPLLWRALTFYRIVGSIPSNQPNLHACAHLYASDRNGMFLISRALGFADGVSKMGSLSHSVVFHVGSKGLLVEGELEGEEEREEAWYVQEAWSPRSGETRGLHESKIWDARGVHIASTWQDGLVKKGNGTMKTSRQEILEENLKMILKRGTRGGKL